MGIVFFLGTLLAKKNEPPLDFQVANVFEQNQQSQNFYFNANMYRSKN